MLTNNFYQYKMKKVLIISPHFPPSNTPDMQRIRQSLPFFDIYGWQVVVVAVLPEYTEAPNDKLLLKTVPKDIEIVRIKALDARITRKFGLGNLGLRAIPYYAKTIKQLMKKNRFDLVYFSTTMFPVMALGRWWKFWYKIPYIIDMQDPWRSDHYLKIPKKQRPPKFAFAYLLEKILERFTMKKVDGIISVSQAYCDTLIKRYKNVNNEICKVITFGVLPQDMKVAIEAKPENPFFNTDNDDINIVYVGRGGTDMHKSLSYIFCAIKKGRERNAGLFSAIRIFFLGTSYAKSGEGKKTIEPVAAKYGLENVVREITDRIGYFQALKVMSEADILLIPGSEESAYTASKIYPYMLAQKPVLAVFHQKSSVVGFMKKTNAGICVTFDAQSNIKQKSEEIYIHLNGLIKKIPFTPPINEDNFADYYAEKICWQQIQHFEKILRK